MKNNFFSSKIIIIILTSALILTACQTTPKKSPQYNTKAASAINVQLGIGYLQQGNVERAKEKLLLALQQNPNSAHAYAAFAYYWERTGDARSAEQYYQRALRMAPNEGDLQNNYGTFLCRQNRYEEAQHYFLRAATNPKYVNTAAAYENAGLCALGRPDDVTARQYFLKALAQDHLRERTIWELVQVDVRLGQDQEAYTHIQRLIALQKNNRSVLALALQLATKLQDHAAMTRYTQLLHQPKPKQVVT